MIAKRFLPISVGLVCLFCATRAGATEAPPQFVTMWGVLGSGPGQLTGPWGTTVDGAGYVYVADSGNNRICKFTGSGEFVLSWGTLGAAPGSLNRPFGIAADGAGRIFVADWLNSRIDVFTTEGVFINQFGTGAFYDVAVGPSGTVFVADHSGDVNRYDVNGNFIDNVGSGTLEHPSGVAVDAAGNLYVCDDGLNSVSKFDPSGNLVMSWGGGGNQPGQFAGPAGIDIDPQGNIFVADHDNSRIQKFGPDGGLLSYWGTVGTEPGQFNVALDVAIGPDGAIYVSDVGNHRVQKFAYVAVSSVATSWGSVKARYRDRRSAAEPRAQGR